MKQTDESKLERSKKLIEELKEMRGGTVLESHKKMGNDPSLIQAFLDQYRDTNKQDVTIPRKYRELIVMAIGMATGTTTTMKVHADLAIKNGATVDEICEVIRIIFFTCGVSKLLPVLENLDLEPIEQKEREQESK